MSTRTIAVPLKEHDKKDWGMLSYWGRSHLICGEAIKLKDPQYSFVGGHRVRLWQVKNNVHWAVPLSAEEDEELDISEVKPQGVPKRRKAKS